MEVFLEHSHAPWFLAFPQRQVEGLWLRLHTACRAKNIYCLDFTGEVCGALGCSSSLHFWTVHPGEELGEELGKVSGRRNATLPLLLTARG